MKRRTTYVVPAVLSMYLAVAGDVAAGELGHYQAGLLNTRDFAVPEPGFYTALYAFQYRTDTLKNRNGDEIGTLSLTGPLGGHDHF